MGEYQQRQMGRTGFIDAVRNTIRGRNLALTTERTYVRWIRSFIRFHRFRHPNDMGAVEVDAYLSWLAAHRRVSPKTQAVAEPARSVGYRLHRRRGWP